MRDRVRDENGNLLRGLSRNQICIGVATDKKHTICFVEGFGKPSQKRSYETFQKHIKQGSTLIHDKETTHMKLVENLGLNSICDSSKELKRLADSENSLNPVNRVYCLLKMFPNAHSGFKAIPHKDCASDAPSDFSSDETKSAVNTLCIHEHFCEI